MRRREFLGVIGGAAALPLTVQAQQRAVPVVGFLSPIAAENATMFLDAYRQGLKERGFIEGQNLKVEYRWAEGH
jgi:putative ABC transport system substrate-binding protein